MINVTDQKVREVLQKMHEEMRRKVKKGSQIKEGFKSVAYSITFRAKDRTLEESDISAAMKKILNGLQSMGIELRQ